MARNRSIERSIACESIQLGLCADGIVDDVARPLSLWSHTKPDEISITSGYKRLHPHDKK
jgi:hypothetical protein